MPHSRSVSIRVGVILVLVMSVLAASAPPAIAADATEVTQAVDGLVVGSQHDSQAEFQNAQELTNLTTTTDGTVTLGAGGPIVIEDFEDSDPLSEWSTSGDVSTTSNAASGSTAVEVSGEGGDSWLDSQSGLPEYPSAGDTFEYQFYYPDGNDDAYLRFATQSGGESPAGYQIQPYNNNGEFTLQVDDGSSTTELAAQDVSIPEGEWLTVRVEWGASGTFDIYLEDASGTELAHLRATDSTFSSGGLYYETWSEGTSIVDAFTLLDAGSPASATYVGPTHQVSDAESAAINITQASDVSIDLTVEYYDDSAWIDIAEQTVSSPGNHTLSFTSPPDSKFRVRADVSVTGENPEFELADESILFNNHAPNASNFQPADGAQLTSSSTEFTADITDPEFATVQGDEVEATLFVDGSAVGSETVTSNQTVSVTHELQTGGSHQYYWELEDSYGSVTTTDPNLVETPSDLRIYNVSSSPPSLVDTASVEVRMYQGDEIYTRSTSDGTIDLSGISPTEPFVVVAEADGYYDRRIFVESLYDTQEIYLLPESKTGVDIIFNLQEYTGQYPQDDTILQVERAVNGSWEVALGDYFGANAQFPATLQYNTRYRLRLINIETGRSRDLGSFTPIASSTQNVVVAPDGVVDVENVGAAWELLATTSLPARTVSLDATLDPDEDTVESWNLTMEYATNESTQTLYEAASSTHDRTLSPELNLTGLAGGEVRVTASYELADGSTETFTRTYRVSEYFEANNSILASLGKLVGLVPEDNQSAFQMFLAMVLTVVLTAAAAWSVPMSTEIVGMVAWLLLAAFGIIGWVSYNLVFVAGVGAASFVYLRRI